MDSGNSEVFTYVATECTDLALSSNIFKVLYLRVGRRSFNTFATCGGFTYGQFMNSLKNAAPVLSGIFVRFVPKYHSFPSLLGSHK